MSTSDAIMFLDKLGERIDARASAAAAAIPNDPRFDRAVLALEMEARAARGHLAAVLELIAGDAEHTRIEDRAEWRAGAFSVF